MRPQASKHTHRRAHKQTGRKRQNSERERMKGRKEEWDKEKKHGTEATGKGTRRKDQQTGKRARKGRRKKSKG